MNSDNASELFPIVDNDGRTIGSATRGECHSGSMLLHPVVHLHLFNSSGDLYLQRRPDWKDIQPGKWDTAVGGHVDFGEDTDDAIAPASGNMSMSTQPYPTSNRRRPTNSTEAVSGRGPKSGTQ